MVTALQVFVGPDGSCHGGVMWRWEELLVGLSRSPGARRYLQVAVSGSGCVIFHV